MDFSFEFSYAFLEVTYNPFVIFHSHENTESRKNDETTRIRPIAVTNEYNNDYQESLSRAYMSSVSSSIE